MCITKGAGLLHINSRNIFCVFVGAVNNLPEFRRWSIENRLLRPDDCPSQQAASDSFSLQREKMASAPGPRTSIFGSRARPPGAPGGTSIEESRVAWAANGRRPILVTFIGRRNIPLLLLAVLVRYLYLFKAFQAENSYENGNTFLLFTGAVFSFKLIHLS
jgi:hypothetical protein